MTEPFTTPDDAERLAEIRRELAALGEHEPSEAELAMLRDPLALDDDPDIASIARLSELAAAGSFDDLSQLEKHRVWRTIERRLPGEGSFEDQPSETGSRSGTRQSGSSERHFGPWIAAGLALAATLALVWWGPWADRTAPSSGPSSAEVAEVGDQARAALRALDDGLDDTARTERLMADYQRRLAEGKRQ